jgi:hypothetical protein
MSSRPHNKKAQAIASVELAASVPSWACRAHFARMSDYMPRHRRKKPFWNRKRPGEAGAFAIPETD